ncbi:MAG: hypothetical protein K5922_00155 [Clostridiales bacterium]|nr:hypothetical protein [Clostridiales bacterium]
MKKTRFGICILVLFILITSTALGELTRPMGVGQLGYDAVVISKTVSIRPTQNANAKAVRKLNFGDHLPVMPVGNGWCECYMSETEGLTGYVLEDYILLNPAYMTTEDSTPVYAWQDRRAKRVGLLGRGETYAIIRMDENWILISLRGAAGWIARPSGDPTGTARMRTADVLRAAQQYLLATDTWSGNTRITAETLKNYYSFAEYDATTREWLVTFESWREDVLEVIVDDDTGRVLDNEDVYG